MKTLLVSLVLLLCASSAAKAEGGEKRLNILGGLDFATLTNAGDDGYSATHWLAGVSYDHPLSGSLFFEPGLRYVEKGMGIKGSASSLALDIDVKVQYLEVPLYVKYRLEEGRAPLFFFAGPNVGIKMGDKVSYTISSSGQTFTGSQTGLLGDGLHTFNVSFDAGLGTDFLLSGPVSVIIAGGYSLGLTNIAKGSASTRTRDIQAYAGVGILL